MKFIEFINWLFLHYADNADLIGKAVLCTGGVFVAYAKGTPYIKNLRKKKIRILKQALPEKAHGIIFGKSGSKVVYSPVSDEGMVGVFSATGTGKTAAVGIPTLRSWTGTSFVIDISGDISLNCPDIKDKLIYDPEDPHTAVYNVFGMIDDMSDVHERYEALAELGHLIMPDDPSITGTGIFFYEGGRKILIASLISFYNIGMDFIDICLKINSMGWRELFTEIDKTGCAEGMAYLSGFDPERSTDNAGCLNDCKNAIEFFATNHKVMRSVRRPSANQKYIVPKMIEDHSIFIIIQDKKLELYSSLLNLIVSQQMQYISSRTITKNNRQILLFLDEYASLRISKEVILSALRKYRKLLCRIMIMTQNLADLDLLYGHEATRAILANLKFKLLLGGLNETDSQKYFADLIGYHEKKKHSTSKNSHTVTDTESDNREYIIEPAELDRQGDDVAILLFPGNKGYLKLKKNYYFK